MIVGLGLGLGSLTLTRDHGLGQGHDMTGVITSMARDSFSPRCHNGGGGTTQVKLNGGTATGISGCRTVRLIDARTVVFNSEALTPGNASMWLVCRLRPASSINTVVLHDNGRRPPFAAHSDSGKDWPVWSAKDEQHPWPGLCSKGASHAGKVLVFAAPGRAANTLGRVWIANPT